MEKLEYIESKLSELTPEFKKSIISGEDGKEYTFEIVGEDAKNVANGYWVVVEGNNRLDGNKMVASQPGVTVNATYYIGTDVVKERSIKIKQ